MNIYDKLKAGFVEHKTAYFPPEYPDELFASRLERYLPEIPLYCTDNYVARAVYRNGFVHIEMLLNHGVPKRVELTNLFAWFFEIPDRTGLPLRVESSDPERYRRLSHLSEREPYFTVVRDDAEDAWDSFDVTLSPHDPHSHIERTLGAPPEGVELSVTPFCTYLFFDHERSDMAAIIEAVSQKTRVLMVSTNTDTLTEELHQSVSKAGELRINFITDVPKRIGFVPFVERARRYPVAKQMLLRGRLYDLPV